MTAVLVRASSKSSDELTIKMSELAAWVVKLNICHSVIFPVLSRVPLFDSAPPLAHRPTLPHPANHRRHLWRYRWCSVYIVHVPLTAFQIAT